VGPHGAARKPGGAREAADELDDELASLDEVLEAESAGGEQ
jgi:hypothetical protein